jgi:hypothetical protein
MGFSQINFIFFGLTKLVFLSMYLCVLYAKVRIINYWMGAKKRRKKKRVGWGEGWGAKHSLFCCMIARMPLGGAISPKKSHARIHTRRLLDSVPQYNILSLLQN